MATSTADYATVEAQWHEERRQERRQRLVWVAVGTILLALYPLVDRFLNIDWLGAWIPVLIFVLLAMGLNIVVGYAGLLDLGYVAFFVIGAYTNAFLTSPSSVFVQKGWVPDVLTSFWPAMAISWVSAAIFGVLLGAPTLRLRGDYLAIVTLGFGEIVPDFFTNAEDITNGPRGIGQIAGPPSIPLPGNTDALETPVHWLGEQLGWEALLRFNMPGEIGFKTTDQVSWFWLILVVGLFSLFLITRLNDSRLGRAWQAIREDEVAAASMGINLVTTKLWAFALGASFSGFAGSIFGGYVGVVYPDQFQFSQSIIVLAMVILGGIGNVYGAIAGGIIIGSFDRILAEALNTPLHWIGDRIGWTFLQEHSLTQDRFLIFGLALVLIMLLRPGGLFPSARRRAEMAPESEEIAVAEDQPLYDIQAEQEPIQEGRA